MAKSKYIDTLPLLTARAQLQTIQIEKFKPYQKDLDTFNQSLQAFEKKVNRLDEFSLKKLLKNIFR